MSIGFGRLQQRIDHRTGVRADWRITEQPGFEANDKRAYRILDPVVIDWQIATLDVADQL
jgi:hypothetical protein